MGVETGNQVVNWILQLKELIALVSLCLLIWFTYAKHIPFLLLREQNRSEREGERWAKGMERITEAIEKLEESLNTMVLKMDEMSRNRNQN